MVAQFPETVTTPPKKLQPKIEVNVDTYTENSYTSSSGVVPNRMCKIIINIENIQKELAIATFSRVFAYVQNLAINNINPIPSANSGTINPGTEFIVTKPESGFIFSVDASELSPVCIFSLAVANLRLDYMDEYFNSTLAYLTDAIATDLNPNV